MLMALSNVYVVLKTGFSLGLALTSCLMAYGVFEVMGRARIVSRPLGILENNAIGSIASAAGFMTGGGNMAAIPALLVVTGSTLAPLPMMSWFAVVAAMGVFAAIPIKRLLINVEQLPFPSSVAAAETIRALHEADAGPLQARTLLRTGLISAAFTFLRSSKLAWLRSVTFPGRIDWPFTIAGNPAASWSFGLDASLMLLGSGALMGPRTGWSLMLGSILGFGVLAPWLVAHGVVTTVAFGALVKVTLWPGAAMLVAAGFVSLSFQLAGMMKWFVATLRKSRRAKRLEADPLRDIECPASWFWLGFLVTSPFAVWMMSHFFAIPLWAALLAIPLALFMGVVAARVTGETDITPTKALGPATQLFYGVLLPGQVTANIMSANVTGGVGLHAADLLSDLKTGRLLGANPRQQLIGQLVGVVAGAMVVVPAFQLLVPRADVLGTEALPAPAVLVWAAISRALASGVGGLPIGVGWLVAIGAISGTALALLERFLPPRVRPFIPSASATGVAMVLPASMTATMCLGAAVGYLWRRHASTAKPLLIPAAAGAIAGESLMGILLAMLVAAGILKG
jgi:uncharacterized oligopeptide transporter (OPT) family protein